MCACRNFTSAIDTLSASTAINKDVRPSFDASTFAPYSRSICHRREKHLYKIRKPVAWESKGKKAFMPNEVANSLASEWDFTSTTGKCSCWEASNKDVSPPCAGVSMIAPWAMHAFQRSVRMFSFGHIYNTALKETVFVRKILMTRWVHSAKSHFLATFTTSYIYCKHAGLPELSSTLNSRIQSTTSISNENFSCCFQLCTHFSSSSAIFTLPGLLPIVLPLLHPANSAVRSTMCDSKRYQWESTHPVEFWYTNLINLEQLLSSQLLQTTLCQICCKSSSPPLRTGFTLMYSSKQGANNCIYRFQFWLPS